MVRAWGTHQCPLWASDQSAHHVQYLPLSPLAGSLNGLDVSPAGAMWLQEPFDPKSSEWAFKVASAPWGSALRAGRWEAELEGGFTFHLSN